MQLTLQTPDYLLECFFSQGQGTIPRFSFPILPFELQLLCITKNVISISGMMIPAILTVNCDGFFIVYHYMAFQSM
jgi:hypothetical protein